MDASVKLGIIGCGNIFTQYVKGCRAFEILDLVACADLDVARAQARAEEFGIAHAYSVEALLADPAIELVVNLTVPQAHAEVSMAILQAGKHAYSEKPLALERTAGAAILELARQSGKLVGCAPDTFLGGGLQTCRKLIDDGAIGRPVAAVAFFTSHGPESWHPNPGFFYQRGGGPMFDMAPYYLTALINLLGPVQRVTGSAQMSFPERIATSKERMGERLPVEIPTHITAALDFASGAVGTLITSFDMWGNHLPRIEIYGETGSLSVPDPNLFGGDVLLRKGDEKEWTTIPLTHSAEVGRGIGVADLAYAIRTGRPARASGELAYHVLDLMQSIHEASANNQHIHPTSHCERPAALPVGLATGVLD
jgi:predicted dehydrogenase